MRFWPYPLVMVLFVAGAVCILGCSEVKEPQPATPPSEAKPEIVFIGKFVSIDYLPAYEGSVLVTHFNPMFVLVIDVADPPTDKRIKKGLNALAIHSPSQVFASCDLPDSDEILLPELKGKKFTFSLQKNGDDLVWPQARDIK
jgi:hypothetical protein